MLILLRDAILYTIILPHLWYHHKSWFTTYTAFLKWTEYLCLTVGTYYKLSADLCLCLMKYNVFKHNYYFNITGHSSLVIDKAKLDKRVGYSACFFFWNLFSYL